LLLREATDNQPEKRKNRNLPDISLVPDLFAETALDAIISLFVQEAQAKERIDFSCKYNFVSQNLFSFVLGEA
jgi:hypothetical protein